MFSDGTERDQWHEMGKKVMFPFDWISEPAILKNMNSFKRFFNNSDKYELLQELFH